jgi:hypothetical protein
MRFYYIIIHVQIGARQAVSWQARILSLTIAQMRKDAPLAFRIPAELKKKLQEIANHEARSISQTCEMFLRLGVEGYQKEGSKYLQRFLTRQKKEDLSE